MAAGEAHRLLGGFQRQLSGYEFNADDSMLLVEYELGNWYLSRNILELWDVSRQQHILTRYDSKGTFSPDGQLLVTGEPDGALHFYNAYSGEDERPFRPNVNTRSGRT